MDNINGFSSQRTRREDFRAAAEPKKSKSKSDTLFRLMALQTAVCVVLVSITAIVCKISPAAREQIGLEYSRIMSVDMSAKEVLGSILQAAKFAFEPVRDRAVSAGADAAAETTATDENSIYSQQDTFEAVSDLTGETVAVGGIMPAGGSDLSAKQAKKGTSFAPYYITVDAVIPVKGKITSPFGYRTNPITGSYGFHTGVDIGAAEGTPIACAYYGIVKETGENDSSGKYVIMEHSDGLQTRYYHCSQIYVAEGAVIRQGETIALVGSTGMSTGAHLHFEVRINSVCVNPAQLIEGSKTK